MKKHIEKPLIDDLFARKLGNMSMPPSADGFERLQARMGQQRPEVRIVFWRNPTIQRYAAAAACLLLVCLLGWRYWPSGETVDQASESIAANQQPVPPLQKTTRKQSNQQQNKSIPDAVMPTQSGRDANSQQVAVTTKAAGEIKRNSGLVSRSSKINKMGKAISPAISEPIVAQTKPNEIKPNTDVSTINSVAPANQATIEQLADNKAPNKPNPVAERVLVVTIEEPQALVAARQAAKPAVETSIMAKNDMLEKEIKAGSLWQQVKRIKQGDVFARQDNGNNDDRGLLSRAYNGIKHSFEKDKAAKQ